MPRYPFDPPSMPGRTAPPTPATPPMQWQWQQNAQPGPLSPPPPKPQRINDLPKINPGDNLSAGDTINYAGNLTDWFFKAFGPLQGQTADIYSQALSGNIPGAVEPLIAGRVGQVNAAIPHAQRQVTDTTAPGGAQTEALTNLSQQGISERAKAVQEILGPLQAQGLEMGSNVAARAIQNLLGIGGLRVGLKAADNGGGGKKK